MISNFLQAARHYSSLEEAMFRNIEACQQLAKMTRTALGPHGKYLNNILISLTFRNEQNGDQPFG